MSEQRTLSIISTLRDRIGELVAESELRMAQLKAEATEVIENQAEEIKRLQEALAPKPEEESK